MVARPKGNRRRYRFAAADLRRDYLAEEGEFLKNRPQPVGAPTAAPAGAPAAAPNITLTSMPLGPMPKEREKIVISDDRARVFVIASQGSRLQAIVDGVPGPLCRKLRWP